MHSKDVKENICTEQDIDDFIGILQRLNTNELTTILSVVSRGYALDKIISEHEHDVCKLIECQKLIQLVL